MKKRILISIIFVLIISYVLIFLVDLSHKKYVIIGTNNSTIVYYNDKNEINRIVTKEKLNQKYSFENYEFYQNSTFINGYLSFELMDGRTIPLIYSENYEKLYSDLLIAKKGNFDLKIKDVQVYNEASLEDENIIKKALLENSLDLDYSDFKKSKIQMDNDLLTLYIVNNYGKKHDAYYCFAFIINSNNQVSIVELSKSNEPINAERIIFQNLIDIDLDDQYELLLETNNGDNTSSYYRFYKYNSASNEINELK